MQTFKNKYAFLIKNKFMARELIPLCQELGGISFIHWKLRRYVQEQFTVDYRCWYWERNIINFDGQFKYLITHTRPRWANRISRSKLVYMQYGYAKSKYNYAEWRASADVNLVYGQHAYDGLKKYNNAFLLGVKRPELSHHQNEIKTVLYAPTWGDLCSVKKWLDEIIDLSTDFKIIIKAHHLMGKKSFNRPEYLRLKNLAKQALQNIHIDFDADSDLKTLMREADLVISDYSGAIFDALLYQKPLVLIDSDDIKDNHESIEDSSIEIKSRKQLGAIALPGELRKTVEVALNAPFSKPKIFDELFFVNDNYLEDLKKILA